MPTTAYAHNSLISISVMPADWVDAIVGTEDGDDGADTELTTISTKTATALAVRAMAT